MSNGMTTRELLAGVQGELIRLNDKLEAQQTLLKQQIDSNQKLTDGRVADADRRLAVLEQRQWGFAKQAGASASGGAAAAGMVLALIELLKQVV